MLDLQFIDIQNKEGSGKRFTISPKKKKASPLTGEPSEGEPTWFCQYRIHLLAKEVRLFIFVPFMRGWIFLEGVESYLCVMLFESEVQHVLEVGHNKTENTRTWGKYARSGH